MNVVKPAFAEPPARSANPIQPREEISMFVRNCWYMAGWSRDFTRDELKAVTMLNEPIVIYRKNDGGLVALQDRCCHRFAPLSLGRLEHDDLRCMYHGLKFAPSGKCIEIPGPSQNPPASLRARLPDRRKVQRRVGLDGRSGAGRRRADSGFRRNRR